MKLNKPLIRKMIKRIETMPESYDQRVFVSRDSVDGRPRSMCGTVTCLAGEAIICSNKSIQAGIRELLNLNRLFNEPMKTASQRMGLEGSNWSLWQDDAGRWPTKFKRQFQRAKTYKGQASAAVNLLKAILKTDGKILGE